MKKSVIFLSLFAFVLGQNVTEPQSNISAATQIVNGRDAKEGDVPFQVSLQRTDGWHFCGGAIVNRLWIVTAAHCTTGQTPSGIQAAVGTINYESPKQLREAITIVIHKGYDPNDSHRNDISLIKVKDPFNFDDLVKPVKLPQLHAKTPAGRIGTVSGWGLNSTAGYEPVILQVVDVTIMDQEQCQKAIGNLGTVYPTMICANSPAKRQGTCSGDSGGPLTVGGDLTGIVSWGVLDPDCASPKFPTLFTRVSEYVKWINKNIKK